MCPIAVVALIAIVVISIVIGCLVMMRIRRMNYGKTRKQYYDHADGCRKKAADKDLSDEDRDGQRKCAEEDEKRARAVPDTAGGLEEANGQLQEYQARDDDLVDCAWKDEGGARVVTDGAELKGEEATDKPTQPGSTCDTITRL